MALFDYIAHQDDGGNGISSWTIKKLQPNIEVYGADTDTLMQDILSGAYKNNAEKTPRTVDRPGRF